MRLDILATALAAVAIEQMAQAVQQRTPPAAVDDFVQGFAVADEQLEQRMQVGRAPMPSHITFGKADIAAAQRCRADRPVANAQRRTRRIGVAAGCRAEMG